MEKRVTCPHCEHQMTVNIWSETLAQVIRCSSCTKKFTHDPAAEEPPVESQPSQDSPKKQSNDRISKMVGKGLRGSMKVAAAPVKMAQKGMQGITEKANSLASPDGGGQGPVGTSDAGREGSAPQDGLKRLVGSKTVNCPYCQHGFQAGLPDNEKDILTTQCPQCTKIFTFLRKTPAERKAREIEEAKAKVPEEDEDFAIPVQLKESMAKDEEGDEGTSDAPTTAVDSGTMDVREGQGPSEPAAVPPKGDRAPPGPPPWFKGPSGTEDDGEWDEMELVSDGDRPSDPMGRLLPIMCPFCSETFNTPAPRKKKKVNCPICEEDFWINSHGELVAKKAMGGFTGGLARIIGVEAMRNYQDTIRESMEGFEVLMDGEYLREKMRNRSGIAGVLLVVVALLGILYTGALLFSIPGIGENEASGNATVTGDVIFDMDSLEGANVNITDLDVSNTTNSAGYFLFHDIPAGDHTLEITAPGKGTLMVSFTIGSKEIKRGSQDLPGLVLPAEGTKTMDITEDRVERAGFVTALFAVFVFLISLLALMGGLLSLQGRRFHAAIFLGILSVASIGFIIGSLLGILAVIFIMLGKKEFIS